ncbi:glutamine-rich protein 2 [Elephas maximus indicus]|uniref:glutamine-rich protein 2 n=1 Tax=Elephas maximus indicus TaxID=99487 RepID=UPI0021166980|nr:glutamine-rich protein 2 [Elephas maximus indicus]
MTATKVSLRELADLAIGTPEVGAVNFTALHTLIVAILNNLNLHEAQIDFKSQALEQVRYHGTPRPSVSAPQLSLPKERRRSMSKVLPQVLESQVKDLGVQVQDLSKQLKTMETQVQGIVTHVQHFTSQAIGINPDTREWLEEKLVTTMMPEKAMATLMPEKKVMMTTLIPEESTTTAMPGKKSTTTGMPEKLMTLGKPEKLTTSGMPEKKSMTTPMPEKLTTTMMPKEPQRGSLRIVKDDEEAEVSITQAMGLLQDTIQEVQILQEAHQKVQELPEMKAQDHLSPPRAPSSVLAGQQDEELGFVGRLSTLHCPSSLGPPSPFSPALGQHARMGMLCVGATQEKLLWSSTSKLFFQIALEKRVEELEKQAKERDHILDQVVRKLSLIPVGDEVTMVTWEELEQAITDGWKASQATSETSTVAPKHKGQGPLTSADTSQSGVSTKHPSTDSTGGFVLSKTLSGSSGTGHPSDRTSSRDRSRIPSMIGFPMREQHSRTRDQAGMPRSHHPSVSQFRIDTDRHRSREQHSSLHPGRDEPDAHPGLVQQDSTLSRDQLGLGYPDQLSRIYLSPDQVYLGQSQYGLGPPGMDQPRLVYPSIYPHGVVPPSTGQQGVAPAGMDQQGFIPPLVPGRDQQGLPPSTDQRGMVPPGIDHHGVEQIGMDAHGFVPLGMDQYESVIPFIDQSGLVPPGLTQAGTDQRAFVQPHLEAPGFIQPGTEQHDLVQPGSDQRSLVQPGTDQRSLIQPGADQHGLVQPGADQRGLVQPGAEQRGLVQPGADQRGLMQPGAVQCGMVQPGAVQHGMVQPGAEQRGLVQPGADQRGLMQPGAVQRGMVQPGAVQRGLVQPGADQRGMVQPGAVQRGLVQPGANQRGLMQPGAVQRSMVQPGAVQRGMVQPGADQRGFVQPGAVQRGLIQPGADQRGLVQPGAVQHGLTQPGADQHGLVQPGADQHGLVQPGADKSGLLQPGTDQRGSVQPGLVQPGADQHGLVQPGAYPHDQHGLLQPGADQRGLVQPGVDQHGLVQPGAYPPSLGQPGADQHGLLQPGADQRGLVQPGVDQHGVVQPDQHGLVQPGADQRGLAQPGVGQLGLVQPGMYQHGLAQPGADQHGLVQPGAYPRGLVQPSAYPPGLVQAGAYPRGLVQPGTYPHGLLEPGAFHRGLAPHGLYQQGLLPPGTELSDFPPLQVDSPLLVSSRPYQQGIVLPGRDQYGQVSPLVAHPGLTPPVIDQEGLVLHPDQQHLVLPGPDQSGHEYPGPMYPDYPGPGYLRVDQHGQMGLLPNRIGASYQPGIPDQTGPGQDTTSVGRTESSGVLYKSSSENVEDSSERRDSLDKLAPSFPMAVETLRLMGELIGLYVALKEHINDLEEEQTGQTDLEKIQYLIAQMVKKSIPPDLQEQMKGLKSVAKEVRQEKAKLDRLQRILEGEGMQEPGKEVKAGQLSLQLGVLRVTVADIEKELAELRESQERGKVSMEHSVSEASLYLQDQLDKLRTIIESMLTSSSTLLSMSMTPSKARMTLAPGQIDPEATCPACSLDVSHQVSTLVQRYEQLQDMVSNLAASRPSKKAKLQSQDEELLGHVQSAILQVQGDCEKLNITTSNLIEDHRQKQKDIDVLYQGIEKLEKEKANREHLEMEIDVKADKSALAGKVSRIQFDATTEQLNHMMRELVAKMSGQEQDWQKMLDKLLLEMDNKLDRLELDPVKQMLEDRWKSLRQQLKERSPLYQADEAAAMRRQLLAHFHCLSCDRPLETPVTGQIIPVTPVGPGLPWHRSIRPYTIFELEQVRQQSRNLKLGGTFPRGDLGQMERSVGRLRTMHSKMLMDIEKVQIHFGGSVKASSQMIRELLQAQCLSSPCYKRVPDMADYSYAPVPRRCGGSHTLTYPYRRSRLQHLPQGAYPTEEIQIAMKHDEVDILGLDGHIYKGRMDTRLPGILTKDAPGVIKHKSQQSRLHIQRQQPMGNSGQLPLRPQSAQMLAGNNSAPSRQRKDRPVSSEGRLSQSNVVHPPSPDLANLRSGSPVGLEMHTDMPPQEGLEEPTRGPRSTAAH